MYLPGSMACGLREATAFSSAIPEISSGLKPAMSLTSRATYPEPVPSLLRTVTERLAWVCR